MSLKIRRKRILVPTSSGAQNYTITGFGDVDAVIAITSGRDASIGRDAHGQIAIGYWDGTNQGFTSHYCKDNEGYIKTGRGHSNSHIIGEVEQRYNSTRYWREWGRITGTVTDGITITWDNNDLDDHLVELIFIGGTANVSMGWADFVSQTTLDVTLGHEPHVVFMSTNNAWSDDAQSTGAIHSFGFAHYDGTTTKQGATAFLSAHNANTVACSQVITDDHIAAGMSSTTLDYDVTFSRLSATQMRLAGSETLDEAFAYLAIELNDPDEFQMGFSATRTAAGSQSIGGLGFEPDFVGCLLARIGAFDSVQSTTQAQGFGIGVADSSGDAHIAWRSNDGAGTSREDSTAHDDFMRQLYPNADTYGNIAALQSFDSDGFTINYSTLNSTYCTSKKFIWFASGPIASGAFNETATCNVASGCAASETYTGPTYTETATCTAASGCTAAETYTGPTYTETATCTAATGCDASESYTPGSNAETAVCTMASGCDASETYTAPTYTETATCTAASGCTASETYTAPTYTETATCTAATGCEAHESFTGEGFVETATCTAASGCDASETYTAPTYNETATVTIDVLLNAAETWAPPDYVETAVCAMASGCTASELFNTPSALPVGIVQLSAVRVDGFNAVKLDGYQARLIRWDN